MKWFRVAVFVCLVAVLQAGLVNTFAVSRLNVKPDLLLILVVFFAVFSSTRDAIITSFAIGFAADIIAMGQPMGPRTISFGLIGTLLAQLHRVVAVRRISHQTAAVFLCSLLAGLLSYFLTLLINGSGVSGGYTAILATALYSGLLAPFLFLPSVWLMRVKTHRSGRY